MQYLLDGYNILFREEGLKGPLEEQRSRLLEKLHLLAETSRQTLIVVLDAHQQKGEVERHHFHELEVVYTSFGQTADEYIVWYVERLCQSKRQQTKVVTSDRTLMQKVRLERVEVLTVCAFFKEMERKACLQVTKKERLSSKIVQSKCERAPLPRHDDSTSWVMLFEGRLRKMDDGCDCSSH